MSDDLYDPYEYSSNFDAGLWTFGTVATLTNVSWDSAYRDVVKFATRTARNTYLDDNATTIQIENMTYARPGMPVVLPISIHEAQNYNYIRVTNEEIPRMGNDGVRSYCYFILAAEYASPGATRFVLQLDAWQTWVYDVTFNNCYIERGHIGIANELQMRNNGRSYLTIPEGLDVGNEYQVVAHRTRNVMTETEHPEDIDDIEVLKELYAEGMAVLVISTNHIGSDPGTESAPNLETAHGSSLQGMPSGAEYYIFKSPYLFELFMERYAKYPWITQGIISVTIIPKPERYGYELENIPYEWNPDGIHDGIWRIKTGGRYSGNGRRYAMFPNWRSNEGMLAKLPERYRHLRKFFTSPYMVVEMTTFTGTPVILKPEVWTDDDAEIHERASLVPPNQRIVFHPYRYNAPEDATSETYDGYNNRKEYLDDGGEFMDMTTQISNFPTMAVVNNGAIGYMASNAHGIAYQHQSADWSQQKTMRGAENAFGQSSAGIEASKQQAQIGRNTDMAATDIANGMSTMRAGMGGVNALLTGGNPGVALVTGGLAAMQEQMANNMNLGNRLSSSHQSQDVSTGLAGYMRDTNMDLAQFAAKGDYANTIAGINAKVQDARLTQPSVSGQMGGEAFNLIHHLSKISLRWKMISGASLRAVGEYWLRYGYAVQQFANVPESLMCMSNFTYWKLTETYISGNVPEAMKGTIRGILETGVTVWRTPGIIGKIDIADNEPLGGFRL